MFSYVSDARSLYAFDYVLRHQGPIMHMLVYRINYVLCHLVVIGSYSGLLFVHHKETCWPQHFMGCFGYATHKIINSHTDAVRYMDV